MARVRQRLAFALGIAASWAALPVVARASPDHATCEDARIRVQGRVAERWLAPIADACERLALRNDTDDGTRVRIVPSGEDVVIEATTRDGRTAIRRARRPESLGTALDALLVLPPSAAEPSPPPPPATHLDSTSESPSATQKPVNDGTKEDEKPARAAEPGTAFEIGGAVSGRVSGLYASLGPALTASLALGSWLVGVDARWDVDQRKAGSPAGFEMQTVGAGLALARRFRLGFGDVDVGLAPRLVVDTQTVELASREDTYTATDVRLAGLLRASFGHGALRLYSALDTELAPGRLRRSVRLAPGLPALPAWSLGLALGISWGAR